MNQRSVSLMDPSSPTKQQLKEMNEKLQIEAYTGLKLQDEKARFAISQQREEVQRLQNECSVQVKDISAVQVAQATVGERANVTQELNFEMREKDSVSNVDGNK